MKSEYENLSLYEGIKKGIDQCIEYEKGDKKKLLKQLPALSHYRTILLQRLNPYVIELE